MWNWFKNIIDKAFALISGILKEIFDVAFKILMAKLADIAEKTIEELQAGNLSGPEKRAEAFKRIKNYALGNMISVSDSDIYLIIEIFVKRLKKIRGIE